ncbi:hypothetical protein C823_006661 [Eubacterium plexicaudatum ASF492]|nr:hypothetical protein C823_006661 [Eubacterium plexicaudatum ASF492]
MKNQPLKIAACCLAGTLFTTLPAYNVMAAPSAGISQYASAIVKSELNTSSTTAGVSSAVADYLEKIWFHRIKTMRWHPKKKMTRKPVIKKKKRKSKYRKEKKQHRSHRL